MSQFQSQQQLLSVLTITSQTVKVIPLAGESYRVSPDRAYLLVRSGDYVGGGTHTRCRYIRDVGRHAVRVPCYRTEEAPVLQPSIEWLRSVCA